MLLDKKSLIARTGNPFECNEIQQSYSPCFSSVGILTSSGETGLGALVLHYNRYTRTLFQKLVDYPLPYNAIASDYSQLVCGENALKLSFFAKNAFTLQIEGNETAAVFCDADTFTEKLWYEAESPAGIRILGYSKNGDDRDPDAVVPFCVCIKVCKGSLFTDSGTVYVQPENGDILIHTVIACLEFDICDMTAVLDNAPENADVAAAATRDWILSLVPDLSLNVPEQAQFDKLRFSVMGLLFNLTKAEGNLKNHISSFPSRGTYPTHFLWDTCFQNLAYERFSLALAEDMLLQNIELQRSDGKYEQFLCSTWARPHETQPALIGWAALRIAKRSGNTDFLRKTLSSIESNNRWWLTQRIAPCGLIYSLSGLETGQDNSPRFDNGPTIAADMNAYLLNQMYACVELAELLGKKEKACFWRNKAAAFGTRIKEVLYDPADKIFYDRRIDNNDQVKVLSPSGLLPLWAGNVLSVEEAKNAIRKNLLDPDSMFGNVPFPSVAYCDPSYQPDEWWRGPTWMPIAFLMLECLEKYGFIREKREATLRLYHVIAADDGVHELFDSKTGKGMGAAQQGWTCAIFIELIDMLFCKD